MKYELHRLLMLDVLKGCSLQPFIRPAANSTFIVSNTKTYQGRIQDFGKGEGVRVTIGYQNVQRGVDTGFQKGGSG